MPQYLAPGVYVEEVPGTPPIAGVGTSTAAFIGVVDPAAKNPDGSEFTMPFKPGRPADPANPTADDRYELAAEGQMALVTSWDQFKTKFGDFPCGQPHPGPCGVRFLQQRRDDLLRDPGERP